VLHNQPTNFGVKYGFQSGVKSCLNQFRWFNTGLNAGVNIKANTNT